MTNNFEITKEFNAPLDLIWDMHTLSTHLSDWWGPKGLKVIKCDMNLFPSGTFHYGLEAPDGSKMYGKFVFIDIIAKSKLVYVVSFSDEFNGITRHPLSNTWPLEVLTSVNFTEKEGKTILKISGKPINANTDEEKTFYDNLDGMRQGFKGTYDQLDNYLLHLEK
jgi:uncharacterized protein YndB with AHSA1/START domain